MKNFFSMMCALSLIFTSIQISAATKSYDEMTLDEQLVHVAINLQGPWTHPKKKLPETKAQRIVRLKTITRAIMLELPDAKGLPNRKGESKKWFWSDKALAWATFTKMWNESGRFSLKVHSGSWRGDRGKSVCLGQIMKGEESLVGTSLKNTRNCVRRVMAFLIMHQHGCLSKLAKPNAYSMSMIYAGYGTGRTCDPNHWMKIHKKGGGFVKNPDGTYKRNYWARKRGWQFWTLYKGNHKVQKTKSG